MSGLTARQYAYEAIDSERDYQDYLWGGTLSNDRAPNLSLGQSGGDRTLDEFTLYIGGYTTDLLHYASHFVGSNEQLETIRKIAGLCVACMEQHGAPPRVLKDPVRSRTKQ